MNIEPSKEEVTECYVLSEAITKMLSGREGAAVLSTLTMVVAQVILSVPKESREKVLKQFTEALKIGINTMSDDFPGPN